MICVSHIEHRLDLPEWITIHCPHSFCREWHCQYAIRDVGHVKIITSNKHSPPLLWHQVTDVKAFTQTIDQFVLYGQAFHLPRHLPWNLQPHFYLWVLCYVTKESPFISNHRKNYQSCLNTHTHKISTCRAEHEACDELGWRDFKCWSKF